MKRHFALALILLLVFLRLPAAGSDVHGVQSMPSFTWDIRFGFSATGTNVRNPQADGKKLDGYTQDTQVGHFFGMDGYYNRKHIFLKTGIGLSRNKSTFYVDLNSWNSEAESVRDIGVSLSSYNIFIPLQTGIHIINKTPYSMSVYTGPRFIIPFTSSYNSSFIGLEEQDIKENLSDFIWGWTVGLTIRSGKTMIDFEYESGISNISRGFEGTCPQPIPEQLVLNRKLNILSFSYGITF
ncbi:MAG: hypothetical protein IKS24_08550 [Bacteroidaceae bacterium]|nr:hypothetical protein [Bacteroidaceae bacterium]